MPDSEGIRRLSDFGTEIDEANCVKHSRSIHAGFKAAQNSIDICSKKE